MCDDEPQVSHLDSLLTGTPWRSGEDRDVYRCADWVFKRERGEDPDSAGTNALEHQHSTEARDGRLPAHIRVPESVLIRWRDEDVLATRFVAGVGMRECERAYGMECELHDEQRCLSADQMLEIRDCSGMYDFAEGNVVRNDEGLYLVDMGLVAFDQPLLFE